MEEAAKKTSRVRSPGYPMIDLKEAVEKAKLLWDKHSTKLIHKDVALENLGYQTQGGYGGRVLAALKHFGLISMKESDIILTEEAVDLALHDSEDKVYKDTVRKCALIPTSYAYLFNEYKGTLPSDTSLKAKLIKEYKFNADKVDRFISNFRSTINFAGLTETEERREDTDNMQNQSQRLPITTETVPPTAKLPGITTMTPTTTIAVKHYPIPISKGRTAVITFETLPVDKTDIEDIKKWLDLFTKSLTESQGE